jgi:hypothetical protein
MKRLDDDLAPLQREIAELRQAAGAARGDAAEPDVEGGLIAWLARGGERQH